MLEGALEGKLVPIHSSIRVKFFISELKKVNFKNTSFLK